jgi:hypothetical protein
MHTVRACSLCSTESPIQALRHWIAGLHCYRITTLIALLGTTQDLLTVQAQVPTVRQSDRSRLREQRELNLQIEYVCPGKQKKPSKATIDSLLQLRQSLRPQFEVSMPQRFGLDQNGNGIPDVPNTRSYVMNGSSGPALFVVQLDPTPSEPSGAALFAKWTVIKSDGSSVFSGPNPQAQQAVAEQGAASPLTLKLPEGAYWGTMQLSARHGCFQVSHSRTKNFDVTDYVIVAIGDSYSSGEGNPERTAGERKPVRKLKTGFSGSYDQSAYVSAWRQERALRWADDGSPRPVSFYFKYHDGRGGVLNDESPIDLDPQLIARGFRSPHKTAVGTATPEALSHMRAHRSTLAWPAQLAWHIEDGDSKSSVTFVFLAATGATISKGLLGEHSGSKQEWTSMTDQVKKLPPQLDEVKALLAGRDIDLLTVSIGGNDVGFSSVVAALVLRGGASDITFSRIRAVIKSGDWDNLEDQELKDVAERFPPIDPEVDWVERPGMDGLSAEFKKFADKLGESGFPVVRNVLISQYPDATRDSDGSTCDEALGELSEYYQTLRLTASELEFARQDLLEPLNDSLQAVATRNSWILVDGLGEFTTHGVCVGSPYSWASPGFTGNPWPSYVGVHDGRWFRRPTESLTLQGLAKVRETMGTLHPNEYGHAAVSRRAYAILKARGLLP